MDAIATIFAASGIIVVANVAGAATKARRCQRGNDELRADHAHSLSLGSGFPADAGNAKEHDALSAVDSRDENLMPLNES